MPKPEKAKPPDNAEQSARFVSTEKELGFDKNPGTFEAVLLVISPIKDAQKTHAKKKSKG